MTTLPKRTVAQVQLNFWGLLIELMDNFPGLRALAPVIYRIFQQTKKWWWALGALLIATAGLGTGFLFGLIAGAVTGY